MPRVFHQKFGYGTVKAAADDDRLWISNSIKRERSACLIVLLKLRSIHDRSGVVPGGVRARMGWLKEAGLITENTEDQGGPRRSSESISTPLRTDPHATVFAIARLSGAMTVNCEKVDV